EFATVTAAPLGPDSTSIGIQNRLPSASVLTGNLHCAGGAGAASGARKGCAADEPVPANRRIAARARGTERETERGRSISFSFRLSEGSGRGQFPLSPFFTFVGFRARILS